MRLRRKGFVLAEVLLGAAILAFVLCGILATYINCFDLITTSRNSTAAVNSAQSIIEEIRDYSFTSIFNDYNNQTFTVSEIPASRGIIYVDNTNPDLLTVTISVSWQQHGNRIIGEDLDLDGVIDAGEDINANNMLDSPVQIITLVTPK